MPSRPGTAEPGLDERVLPRDVEDSGISDDDVFVVILYNDDYHPMEQVVQQLQKATGYIIERCVYIMLEAHTQGRSIAYTGSESDCERVAGVLRQIRLQVETDRF